MLHVKPSEFTKDQIPLPFPGRDDLPAQDELIKFFDYDPATGSLKNRVNRGRAKAGDEAGTDLFMRHTHRHTHYRRVWFKGKRYLAHVLICVMMFGAMPQGLVVDHKNGIGHDNRIQNIRIVTQSENVKNRRQLSAA